MSEPESPQEWMPRLQQACGVARVARITDLDRSGVEVACAVRPGGHVLQVTNGKGESWDEARAGALLEAAELFGAERVDPERLLLAARAELGEAALDPLELDPAADRRLCGPQVRLAWCRAHDLSDGSELWAPAAAVHCLPSQGPNLGPAGPRWTSNGMGAHPRPEAALLHALLEVAERDGLARALPGGWSPAALRARHLERKSLRSAAPRTWQKAEELDRVGLTAALFDLRPRGRWLGLPVAGALLIDEEEGPVRLTAGYACRLRRDEALLAALLEAAQSRLTDVHGAREDVHAPDARADAQLAEACGALRGGVDASLLPEVNTGGPRANEVTAISAVLQRLRQAGFRRAAAVSLAPPGFPVAVVKVLVPGMLVSELL